MILANFEINEELLNMSLQYLIDLNCTDITKDNAMPVWVSNN